MPLSSPSGGSSTLGLQLSALVQQSFFQNEGSSSLGRTYEGCSIFNTELNECIIGSELNEIGFVNSVAQKKVTKFASITGGTFPGAKDIRNCFRSRLNWGAGAQGSIFAQLGTSAPSTFARSDDNGATWTDILKPAGWSTIRGIVEMSSGRLWVLADTIINDVATSDDGGATWDIHTSGAGAFGATRRNLVVSRDGSRIVIAVNSQDGFAWSNSISGVPVFNTVDLGAITGQLAGPGGNGSPVAFDDFGGCMLGGDFGDLVYTPDFSNYQFLPDADNPLYNGDNVASTTVINTVYSPAHDGFVILSNTVAAVFASAVFYPREDFFNPIAIPIRFNNVGNGVCGYADANGNIAFPHSSTDGSRTVSLIDSFS